MKKAKKKFPIMERVPVHKPRYAPYNGKPCHVGHRARRIINLKGRCAECHRLETKSQRLYEYIGQPRKTDGMKRMNKPCNRCGTYLRYKSTNKCVNCQRYHAFNYSRKIGTGKFIARRKK